MAKYLSNFAAFLFALVSLNFSQADVDFAIMRTNRNANMIEHIVAIGILYVLIPSIPWFTFASVFTCPAPIPLWQSTILKLSTRENVQPYTVPPPPPPHTHTHTYTHTHTHGECLVW